MAFLIVGCLVHWVTAMHAMTTMSSGLKARPELGGFPLPLRDEAEWLDLATLTLADFLEQVVSCGRVSE
jgi:hypothetical protein